LFAVRSLQYLATITQPNAVFYLGRFNHSHLTHCNIYSITQKRLLFQTYFDISYSGCKESSCSTGRYITIACSGVVGWSTKCQFFVTLSSTEVEYVTTVKARNEIK